MTLKPSWKKQDQKGDWIFGVDQEALDKVRLGYACNRCLEEFTDTMKPGGMPVSLAECYVCGEPTRHTDFVVVPTPAEWRTALAERNH